jgi:CPA2 family monovalent cation:H+ antiporter-2
VNAGRIGNVVLRPNRRKLRGRAKEVADAAAARKAERERMFAEEIALVEAAGSDDRDERTSETRENGPAEEPVRAAAETAELAPSSPIDIHAEQAGQQSDARANRQRDPEY